MADTTNSQQLTPEQLAALTAASAADPTSPLRNMGVAIPAKRAPVDPGAAPSESGLLPMGAATALSGGGLPNLRAPTPKESIAAGMAEHGTSAKQEGKDQYQQLRPMVTDPPGTSEYDREKLAQMDFDKLHPFGGDISANPGRLGKVEHVLSKVGNIAGDVVAPGVMANISGTDLNKDRQRNDTLRSLNSDTENEAKQAQTASITQGNEEIPHINPNTGETEMIARKSLPVLEAAEIKGNTAQGVADTKAGAQVQVGAGHDQTAQTIAAGKSRDKLLSMGFDEQGQPLPDDQLSSQQRAVRDVTQAHAKLQQAQAAYDAAKTDPNSPLGKALTAEKQLRMAELQQKIEDHGLEKPSGQAASRGSAAEAALELLPGLEDTIKKNARQFGPIMGRINSGEIKIGDVSPDVQKAYAQLESFYALQPSVHGFRNAEFVKDFDTFVGNLSTNPDAVIAGLEGLRPTLQTVANEGRTYHKRIVEGAQNTPTATPNAQSPPAGGIPSFKDFKAGQPATQ
jgi:hypothetical protein